MGRLPFFRARGNYAHIHNPFSFPVVSDDIMASYCGEMSKEVVSLRYAR